MADLGFYVLSNNVSVILGRWVIIKGWVQADPVLRLKYFHLRESNSEPLDQQASALSTKLPGLLGTLEYGSTVRLVFYIVGHSASAILFV